MSGQDAARPSSLWRTTTNRRRRYTPAHKLPRRMTVCIAAIPVAGPRDTCIVTVSDMMLSNDVSSVEVATFKCKPLGASKHWWCMYSGDPSEYEELERRTNSHLSKLSPQALDVAAVMAAVESAYDETICHHIEAKILRPFRMRVDQFFASGLKKFGESYFRELSQECRNVSLGTDLLVVGFDSSGPHVFAAEKDFASGAHFCTSYDQIGFHAIGAGASAAIGNLLSHQFFRMKTRDEVVYHICEAALAARTARSVGEIANVIVFNPDGTESDFPFGGDNDVIQEAYEARRDAPIPENALQTIKIFLNGAPVTRRPEADQPQTKDPEAKKRGR